MNVRILVPKRHGFVRTFLRSPTGVLSAAIIATLAAVGIVAPPIIGDRAEEVDFAATYQQPSWDHLLGTDATGRDVMLRVLVGTRLSLQLGLMAAALGIAIGTTLGSLVPVARGASRQWLQRWIDGMLAFPSLLKALLIGAVFGVGTGSAVVGVGVAVSFPIARLTSTLALSVGGREYVHAARVVGVKRGQLMRRYIIPNIAEPLLVATSLAVSSSIVSISALSYLGLGVRSPNIDWGIMLTDGVKAVYLVPAAALGPGAAIAITALAFGFFGEAMARSMNPLLWVAAGAAPRQHGRRERRKGASSLKRESASQRSTDASVAVSVSDLHVSYTTDQGRVEIVRGVSFAIRRGEMLGLVGESGSGKTMTALAVAQLVPHPLHASGATVVDGKDVRVMPRRRLDTLLGMGLAIVFQDPASALNPALRVGQQIELPLRRHTDATRREVRERALYALKDVHLPAPDRQLKRYPHELSGGMRQRVMIAKALMKSPVLLIADEPTTALDVTVQAQIMALLREIKAKHRTAILLISHNLALVSQTCDRIAVMYAGSIVEELDAGQLTRARHPYTVGLLGAIPEIGQARYTGHANIPGEVPDIADLPTGCPYHPRCPLAIDRCRRDVPELLQVSGRPGRVACHVANDESQQERVGVTRNLA